MSKSGDKCKDPAMVFPGGLFPSRDSSLIQEMKESLKERQGIVLNTRSCHCLL